MKFQSIGLATGVVLMAACTTQNTDLIDKTPIDGGADVSSEEALRDGPVTDAQTEDGDEDGGCPPGHRLAWLKPGCEELPVCSNNLDASACTFCGCDGVTTTDYCIPGFPYKHTGACLDGGDAGPQEVPSAREVRFHVANAEASARFLGVDGYQCLSWSVERLSPSKPLTLGLANYTGDCGCSGTCDYYGKTISDFKKLDSGEVGTIVWDGREYVTWTEDHVCSGGNTWTSTEGVLQPVEPGHYRITVSIAESLGPECSSDAGDLWNCVGAPFQLPPGIEPLCEAPSQPRVEFDIPPTGDVDVMITLGNTQGCPQTGVWAVSYVDCEELKWGTETDEITLTSDGNGGVVGSMTTHLGAGDYPMGESSSASIDSSNCQLTAVGHAEWSAGAELWCDYREIVADLHGDTGMGTMTYTYCQGYPPNSGAAIHDTCTALLVRNP